MDLNDMEVKVRYGGYAKPDMTNQVQRKYASDIKLGKKRKLTSAHERWYNDYKVLKSRPSGSSSGRVTASRAAVAAANKAFDTHIEECIKGIRVHYCDSTPENNIKSLECLHNFTMNENNRWYLKCVEIALQRERASLENLNKIGEAKDTQSLNYIGMKMEDDNERFADLNREWSNYC